MTIAALSGDNGILSNAAKAKQETEKAEILEQIRLDIYSEMANNLGKDPTDADIERIAGEYGKVEGNTFYDKVLTTTEGNYKIKLSEIWDSSTTLKPGETATANRNKYESDGKTATVPEGYTVSNKEGEMSIDDGLVIYSPNGDKNGNVIKEAGVSQRLNTGLTTALCNIYDMGGNVGEMTTELNPNLSETVVLRGNGYYSDSPAGHRWDSYSSYANANCGFRATLFLK